MLTPGNTVIKVVGDGDTWWCEWRVTYPDAITYLCVDLIELRDGLVHREMVYWAPVFEPRRGAPPGWSGPTADPDRPLLGTARAGR